MTSLLLNRIKAAEPDGLKLVDIPAEDRDELVTLRESKAISRGMRAGMPHYTLSKDLRGLGLPSMSASQRAQLRIRFRALCDELEVPVKLAATFIKREL